MSSTDPLPRFACPDWWEKIKAGETPMADVPVNEEKAAKARAFFNRLRLPDVAGNPPLRDACGQWFFDILVAFVANEDPATQRRLVWEVLCMVPKKNSKSTYTAALALTALYLAETPNAQMLLIGPSQNISARCFDQAQGMIRLDPTLTEIFKVQDHLKTITRRRTGTKLEVKTFDTTIVTGEIPILTIIDEVHELGKKASAVSVMQQIRGGGITTTGGQVFMITTQSDKRPAGIWKSELQKARAIRDGRAGPGPIMLPVLYEFPAELQKDEAFWRDSRNWPLVLPNLGLSIDKQRLEDDYTNNGSISAEAEQIWVSQHLNIEIGLGLRDDRWVGADYWEEAAVPELTLEEIIERSEVCTIGIDGGGMDDLLGLSVIGRDEETKEWRGWCGAWAHPSVLERRKNIASQIEGLADEDAVTICDSPTQDLEELVAICQRIFDAGLLPAVGGIGLDNASGVGAIIDALELAGIPTDVIKSVSQGYLLTGAIKGVERKLFDGTLVHAGQPLMTWCVGNAMTEMRGNAIVVTKAMSGSAKIDPLMALFNAAYLMSLNPAPARRVLKISDNYVVA